MGRRRSLPFPCRTTKLSDTTPREAEWEILSRPEPKFDKDIELLKISLVSEEIRTAYFNFNAIYFSFMIPVAIVELGFGSQIGIIVYVGLLIILFVLGGLTLLSTKRYLRRFSRLQPLIHNVENGKANGDLNEILKGLGK